MDFSDCDCDSDCVYFYRLELERAGEDGPIENVRRWLCEEQTDEVRYRFLFLACPCWNHSRLRLSMLLIVAHPPLYDFVLQN